ncbi:DNA adenine methylase [Desulfosporosinus nitroreducens]|uniref:DNA adenine methylase n=1 Tax=Desulfosporosinus nitroreducens TaxID=2018668 RepID=UPI00207C7CC0|nr:DNA adenine methylase [Desulfosporosinus nitroreducens]MCO1599740.1 DNA adenine methylase [Desulfosporosinus nitroreducens]
MNSPIKWMGGKYRLRKTIVKIIPEHICYCEPFGGAGWVLFEKPPSEVEVYNDINSELVNFFLVVKEKPEQFIQAFNYLLISREIFQKYKALSIAGTSDVNRAVRFYYLLHFSFGALMKDFMITPLKKPPMVLERVRDNIISVRDRLVNTIIENRDVEKIISSYDRSSTFFYCDPPYYGLTDYTSQGSKPFSKEDHVRLKECLSKIQGKFLLSINDHPEIRELYTGFNINPVEVRYSVCRTDKSSKAGELLISNYKVGVVQ